MNVALADLHPYWQVVQLLNPETTLHCMGNTLIFCLGVVRPAFFSRVSEYHRGVTDGFRS